MHCMSDVNIALKPLFSVYAVKLGANHSNHFDHHDPFFRASEVLQLSIVVFVLVSMRTWDVSDLLPYEHVSNYSKLFAFC